MRCECGGTTWVVWSRPIGPGGRVVKRRRGCYRCKKRWTTHECTMRKLEVYVPTQVAASVGEAIPEGKRRR